MNRLKYPYFFIIITILWSGMIAGISFLEAPVKFTAPSLTLPIGLDVGRHVFGAFNKVEIVFGTILMLLIFMKKSPLLLKLPCFLAVILLILETFWLLPVLDKRALIIIAGQSPEGASPHTWYIVFEAIKLISLLIAGSLGIRTLINRAPSDL